MAKKPLYESVHAMALRQSAETLREAHTSFLTHAEAKLQTRKRQAKAEISRHILTCVVPDMLAQAEALGRSERRCVL